MANISDKVKQIRTAILGKDVRESLASGIEAINTETENTTTRQDTIDSNEATRIANENTRISQENTRVSQENIRANEFNGIKSDYATYKDVMIADSNVAELQNNINKNTTEINTNTQKISQLSNPNLLINGDFQVWQDGDSFDINDTTWNKYTADMWMNIKPNTKIDKDGNALKIISKVEQNINILQPIEDGIKLNDKEVTLSFEIRGINGFSGEMYARVGSLNNLKLNITDEYKKFMLSTIPVIIDKRTKNGVLFYTTSNNLAKTDQGFEIKNVKLEYGNLATPFIPRLYGEELVLCQRYYERGIVIDNYIGNTINYNWHIPYLVQKRITPTVDVSFNNQTAIDVAGSTLPVTLRGQYQNGFSICNGTDSVGQADSNYYAIITYSADARIY